MYLGVRQGDVSKSNLGWRLTTRHALPFGVELHGAAADREVCRATFAERARSSGIRDPEPSKIPRVVLRAAHGAFEERTAPVLPAF